MHVHVRVRVFNKSINSLFIQILLAAILELIRKKSSVIDSVNIVHCNFM